MDSLGTHSLIQSRALLGFLHLPIYKGLQNPINTHLEGDNPLPPYLQSHFTLHKLETYFMKFELYCFLLVTKETLNT